MGGAEGVESGCVDGEVGVRLGGVSSSSGKDCANLESSFGPYMPWKPATQDQIHLDRKLGTILGEFRRHTAKKPQLCRRDYVRSFRLDQGLRSGRAVERSRGPANPNPKMGLGSGLRRTRRRAE